MITTMTLCKKAEEMAQQYWGLEFKLPIEINGRLTRALGRFVHHRTLRTPFRIEISRELLQRYDETTIFDVLKHELTHWALFVQNKPYRDGHPVFENELRRVGAASTRTIKPVGELHTVVCSKCNSVAVQKPTQGRVMRYTNSRYCSRCCKAPLKYVGLHEFTNGQITSETKQNPHPQPIQPAAKSSLNIRNLVQPGPRGVTNAQMIPAIKKALDNESMVQLQLLKSHYPDVYAGSLRYLGKSYTNKYNSLIARRIGA